MIFGKGKLRYKLIKDWGRTLEDSVLDDIPGVYADSDDRIYALTRGENSVMVFDKNGNYLRSWGKGIFVRAHGIFIGPEDEIYCVDDNGHVLYKFSAEGDLLMTIGNKGQPSNSGCVNKDFRTIKQGSPPFNFPTNVALSPNKEIYVSDGYGNSRIHKFAPDGSLVLSWGEPGSRPGQFNLPHSIQVSADNRVYVADRENSRIQIFNSNGEFLEEWTDLVRPTDLFIDKKGYIYVAELGKRVGLYDWMEAPTSDTPCSRISIFNFKGELLLRWGQADGSLPGNFYAAHGICVDSEGSIYVGEVARSATKGNLRANYFALSKFARIRD